MKTLENHTLLYDSECPLCKVYTSAFIKAQLLDHNGRKAYCNLSSDEQTFVDKKRAANEIALVDTNNKTVIYGIDSLLKVMGHSMPWIERIGNFKVVKLGLKQLYAFISYNRKVIIPSKVNPNEKLQCVPDFNHKYRYAYILFTAFITSIALFQFSKTINLISESGFWRECLIVFGQIVFQSLFILTLNSEKRLTYIGNLMTVSLVGGSILTLVLALNYIIPATEITLLVWFGLSIGFMLYEHIRRVKLLELPKYLSLTWVLYPLLVLLIIR
jgi:predicted DCC family thiol-disulfide oxidoreductase YuxK